MAVLEDPRAHRGCVRTHAGGPARTGACTHRGAARAHAGCAWRSVRCSECRTAAAEGRRDWMHEDLAFSQDRCRCCFVTVSRPPRLRSLTSAQTPSVQLRLWPGCPVLLAQCPVHRNKAASVRSGVRRRDAVLAVLCASLTFPPLPPLPQSLCFLCCVRTDDGFL